MQNPDEIEKSLAKDELFADYRDEIFILKELLENDPDNTTAIEKSKERLAKIDEAFKNHPDNRKIDLNKKDKEKSNEIVVMDPSTIETEQGVPVSDFQNSEKKIVLKIFHQKYIAAIIKNISLGFNSISLVGVFLVCTYYLLVKSVIVAAIPFGILVVILGAPFVHKLVFEGKFKGFSFKVGTESENQRNTKS